MEQLLKYFPAHDVMLAIFLIGVWYGERRSASSRRDQGKRIGEVEKVLERLAARVASGADGK